MLVHLGNRFDDGSVEFGHFHIGHDRCSIAIVSDGSALTVESCAANARVARSANSAHFDRIDIEVDGEAWEVLPEPLGRMPGFERR